MKIHFISAASGDWVRMYRDNELVAEGHSLSEKAVARAIIGRENVTSEEWDDEARYLNAAGKNLDEL